MRKIIFTLLALFCVVSLAGCNKEADGEFLLGQFGAEWKKETFYIVVPIQWTGESPITLKSIEFVKDTSEPTTTYEEDGIQYEIFGTDPSRPTGLYEEMSKAQLQNISGLEINGEGKIVIKFTLGEVKVDNSRKLNIRFESDGKEAEKIVEWKTLEQLMTETL